MKLQLVCPEKGLFHLNLGEAECCGFDSQIVKAVTADPKASFQLLSWADPGSSSLDPAEPGLEASH